MCMREVQQCDSMAMHSHARCVRCTARMSCLMSALTLTTGAAGGSGNCTCWDLPLPPPPQLNIRTAVVARTSNRPIARMLLSQMIGSPAILGSF